MNNEAKIRLAVLGCGAVTELLYLPVLKEFCDVRVTLLIDSDANRRERLASKFNIENTHGSISQCYDLFDAAIVALPSFLRAGSCVNLLVHRKAVLVESPMAISATECEEMICTAEQFNTTLTVGFTRRFLSAHRFAHFLVKKEVLGKVKSFDFREGSIYDWPITTDYTFRKEAAGGGVLIDTGAHTLDCLLQCLGGFSEVEYFDDAEGGVEANCILNLRLQSGICGVVELSRTRRLRNTGIIHCELGVIEIGLSVDKWNDLKLVLYEQPYALDGQVANLSEPSNGQSHLDLTRTQIKDFVAAINGGRNPDVDGRSAECSIQLIEACYSQRKPLQLPWIHGAMTASG
jgi:predicted dehydrogenase